MKRKTSIEVPKGQLSLIDGQRLLLTPCKTKDEFQNWIRYFLDIDLPSQTVSRFADTNPLDAIWEVYKICVLRENPADIQELLYVASRGAGKCVAHDTQIKTVNGLHLIKDIKVGDVIWTGWDWQPVLQTFDEGVKQAIKLTTGSGRSLTGSWKHRIQALNPDSGQIEWRYLPTLKVGDFVYTQNGKGADTYPKEAINFFVRALTEDLGYDTETFDRFSGDVDRRSLVFWRDICYRHGLTETSSKAMFLLEGGIEQISSIEVVDEHLFDLEVNYTHAYWSNGIISHNTLGMAIAELMIMLHDQRDVIHVGVSQAQAKRAYEYQTKFLLSPKIRPFVDPPGVPDSEKILIKNTMEKSIFNINGEQVSIEVLPATLKALNGPHASFLCMDEIDTASGESLRAIKEASGILDTKKGRRPLRIGISTRKGRFGLMHKQMENAVDEDRVVRRWTALEFTEQCPDTRSGIVPTPLYTNLATLETLTEQEFQGVDQQRRKDFERHEMLDKCRQCAIAPYCLTDLKKQSATSPMLKTIGEMIKKVKTEGADWASAQLMNLTPSLEGIVFREFEEKKHLKTWNEMWQLLTGQVFPGECTHDIFIKKCQSMRLMCFAGVDWGWSNPNTVVYVYVDNKDNVYVVRCDGMTFISQPGWIHHMKTKYHGAYKCQMYFPDIADQGAVDEMRKAGLPVSTTVDKLLNTGIQTIKKFLKTPGQPQPKIYFAADTCGPIVSEFLTYHYKTDTSGEATDIPQEGGDHWLDALRYIMATLFSSATMMTGTTGDDEFVDMSAMDVNGTFLKTPNAEEFAKAQGIQFNAEIDTSQLGKVERTKGMSDPDSDDEISGGGGFLWSL